MFNRLFCKLLLFLSVVQVARGNQTTPVESKSLFASGRWVKIEANSTGIHQISFSWLKNIGFLHPESVRLFGSRNEEMSSWNNVLAQNRPVQIPTFRVNEGTGNESLLFYVQGPIKWEYDPVSARYFRSRNQSARGKSWYYLTDQAGVDLRLPTSTEPPEEPETKIADFDDFGLWEEENLNLLESGKRWFTALVPGGTILKKTFSIPDRLEAEPVKLNIHAAGRSIFPTGMELSLNGVVQGNLSFSPIQPSSDGDFATADSLQIAAHSSGTDLTISLKYNGSASDQCWFDNVVWQVRSVLNYRGNPLLFRDSRSVGKTMTVEYQVAGVTSGLQLWEVTNPLSPRQIAYRTGANQLRFKVRNDTLRSFLLFDPTGQYPGCTKLEEAKNADLLQMEAPEYLVVAPSQFYEQAIRLAQFHRLTDGMTVEVATIESVFNEFSGGYPDVAAIRNFIRMLYAKQSGVSGSVLKYLLLFGKGTYDPVHDATENNPNWIPGNQSENSLQAINSFVTDDYFGFMDLNKGNQSGTVDIGIGRIPAVSLTEASNAVNKIIGYGIDKTLGNWRNNLTFIGDDKDDNIHVADSEALATLVETRNPEFQTSKIYLDAYPLVFTPEERYPQVNEAIRRSVQNGSLIVNYIGHASEDGLAHERVLTIPEIDAFTNKYRLPLFVTATCEFSRWDMTMKRSAGEHLLFNPSGGAIALLSATRLVYSASNFGINKSFFNHVFDRDDQGAPLRLGDLIKIVKNENSGSINTLKFCLLGDPALRLNFPDYRTKCLDINHQSVDKFSGNLSPLSLVTIGGALMNQQGRKVEGLNGNMIATIYDQPVTKKTLGNGGVIPFSYTQRENIIFNGDVAVKNGEFSYSFVVPKDVSFNEEAGLIRYYFSDGKVDGNGSFSNIYFNGSDTNPITDAKGPEITLYLENENFREGASVSPNPLLLVYLKDDNGINTTGFGIGHDLTLELDGNTAAPVLLNDFYQTDPGTWKSGTILFPMSTLSTGYHTLKVKVWDTANNSTSATLSFYVNKNLIINSLSTFPNPFSDVTRFLITQNRYDELLDVNLEILDLAGRKLYASHQALVSRGYEINDLIWNPNQMSPVPGVGIYIYRITLTDHSGFQTKRTGRLVWEK